VRREVRERPVCVGYFGPLGRTAAWTGGTAWVGPGLWAARRDRFSAGRSDAPAWSAARSGGSGDVATQIHAVGACPRAA